MAISLLHTPEGVRDLYNEECAKKETVSAKIGAVFHRFGYRSIQTPSYEFFDIFNKDRGSVASNQMFKFFINKFFFYWLLNGLVDQAGPRGQDGRARMRGRFAERKKQD